MYTHMPLTVSDGDLELLIESRPPQLVLDHQLTRYGSITTTLTWKIVPDSARTNCSTSRVMSFRECQQNNILQLKMKTLHFHQQDFTLRESWLILLYQAWVCHNWKAVLVWLTMCESMVINSCMTHNRVSYSWKCSHLGENGSKTCILRNLTYIWMSVHSTIETKGAKMQQCVCVVVHRG